MKWIDYINSKGNLEEYLSNKYGEVSAKSLVRLFNTRIGLPLSDSFNTVKSIDNMVFGQFIMAERALTTHSEEYESLMELAYAILRPKDDVIFDNTDDDKEAKLKTDILDNDAKDVIEECVRYSDMRNKFVKEDFAGVFYKTPSDIDEDDEDEEEEVEEESFEAKFSRDWYWYTIVNSLASDDILKHEAIYMMKMRDVAPHLAYLRMKGIIDYKQRKAEEMASKLKR